MSKQISTTELAQIVQQLLTDPEKVGELNTSEQFKHFMTDIAQVVTEFCGGNVSSFAQFHEGDWLVAIQADSSLPKGGGIWASYDPEGSL